MKILDFFRTRPDVPCDWSDPERVHRTYQRWRWSVFLSTMIGYGLFYTCRLNLSMAKPEMLKEGVLSGSQLGLVGMILLLVYGVGRFTNGFLADRSHIGRFMSVALLASACLNIGIGLSGRYDLSTLLHDSAIGNWLGTSFWTSSTGAWLLANTFFLLFFAGWAMNGWAQSAGSAPSIVAMSHWFTKKERGVLYGVWGVSHPAGSLATALVTSWLVVSFGWQWGFIGPGMACALAAMILFFTIPDRPQTYGLPPVSKYKNEPPEPVSSQQSSVWQLQLEVLRNPGVWILALASGCLYIGRYGVEGWVPTYLQTCKEYPKMMMGAVYSAFPISHAVGCATSGLVSDYFFRSNRNIPLLIYGLIEIFSLLALYWVPKGMWPVDIAMLALFGIAMGGLLTYLGGLMAVELVSRRAAGAAIGIVGLVSYIFAGIQDVAVGRLLESYKTVVDGEAVYSYQMIFTVWISALCMSFLFSALLWVITSRRKIEEPIA